MTQQVFKEHVPPDIAVARINVAERQGTLGFFNSLSTSLRVTLDRARHGDLDDAFLSLSSDRYFGRFDRIIDAAPQLIERMTMVYGPWSSDELATRMIFASALMSRTDVASTGAALRQYEYVREAAFERMEVFATPSSDCFDDDAPFVFFQTLADRANAAAERILFSLTGYKSPSENEE